MNLDPAAALALVAPFVAAAITLALAGVAWSRRTSSTALAACALLLLMTVRLIALGGMAWADTLDAKMAWQQAALTAGAFVPVALFVTVLCLVELGRRLTRIRLLAVLLVPLGLSIAVWLQGVHGAVWTDVELGTSSIGVTVLETSPGPIATIFIAYFALLSLASLGTLAARAGSLHPVSRMQVVLLAFAAVPPIVANFVDVLWLIPAGSPISSIPFSLIATAIALVIAYDRYGLFELMPIARAALADQLADAVVVLNSDGQIVGLNSQAVRVFRVPALDAINRDFNLIAPREIEDAVSGLDANESARVDYEQWYLEIRVTPFTDRAGTRVGSIVIMRDLTAQREAEVQKQLVFRTLSHEIRSSVSLLSGYTDEISDLDSQPLDAQRVVQLLRLASIGVERLVDLSNALGDWLELVDEGPDAIESRREEVEITNLIESAAESVKARAARRAQNIEFRLGDVPAAGFLDAERVRRAFTTVLTRAISRNPRGGTIRVEGRTNGTEYRVGIFDSGKVVPYTDVPLMFLSLIHI